MGICFDDLEGLSVRKQREIITNRAKEINRLNNLKYKVNYRGNTSLINQQRFQRQNILNYNYNSHKNLK